MAREHALQASQAAQLSAATARVDELAAARLELSQRLEAAWAEVEEREAAARRQVSPPTRPARPAPRGPRV